MTDSWHATLMDWYRYRRRRQVSEEGEPFVDIELGAPCKSPKRVDSGMSFGSLGLVSNGHTTPKFEPQPQPADSIHLKLDFGDDICIKSLDYETFSRWSAIEGLIVDMEEDGIFVEEFWDVAEGMRVCRGDWDARVRPGWDVHVLCHSARAFLEEKPFEDDSDSEGYESDEERWIDDVLDQYQEEWCLPRWRERVEQERSISVQMQEPSWTVLSLGCAWILIFIVAVVVYTA